MRNIIEELKKKRDFYAETGVSSEEIKKAEKTLGVEFSDDYKEYLQEFGSVSCSGHELTGFSADEALDVVKATEMNKKENPNIDKTLYVIEEAHIDGIVIWQAGTGEIYCAEYRDKPKKIFDSFVEYVETFENA